MADLRTPLRLLDARARCELVFAGPFALLAGGLYGVQLGGGLWLIALCALALVGFVAAQIALEGVVVERLGGDRGQWGPAVAFAWDAATGAIVGFPVFWLLELPAGPAVGAAASFGALYGWIMGYVVCGGATTSLVGVVMQGGARLRTPEHSYAQSLEARGDIQGAASQYRASMQTHPADPVPYFALARLQERMGSPDEALGTLRTALARARLTSEQERLALRRIVDVHENLGRPYGGATDLARYLEGTPAGPTAQWAADTLARLKRRMAEDTERTPLEEPHGQADPDRQAE